jgi:hypothetical protein
VPEPVNGARFRKTFDGIRTTFDGIRTPFTTRIRKT